MAKTEFRTNKNGKAYPITPKTGGAAALVAAVVGGIIAFNAGSGSGAAESVVGQSLSAKTSDGKAEASKGDYAQAWLRLGWKQLEKKVEQVLKCAVSSYGQVQTFFLHTPCKAMERVLLVLGDGKGNTVVISIAWVTMYSAGDAQSLKDLADADGTGSVTPRAAVVLDMANVKFTGKHYASDRRGAMTVISEAAVGSGQPDGEAMTAATQIAVMFPPL